MDQADVLRIDLELDEDVLGALVICAERQPDLDFTALARDLLVAEANRFAAASRDE